MMPRGFVGNAASQVTTLGSYKNILFVNLHRGPGAGLFCSYDAQCRRTLLRLIRDDHRKALGVRRSGTLLFETGKVGPAWIGS